MKVLVTGGGGFLGRYIVHKLLARGDAVVSLGRSPQPELASAGVTVIQGSIADRESVFKAAIDCEAVIHVAAKAGFWGSHASYFGPNVIGTRNVIAACQELGIPDLVYTSTPSVVFSGESFEGADESLPYGTNFLCHYAETKAQAEQEALAANGPDLRVCALRPHLIWGIGDPHLIPRVIAKARSGKLRQVGDGTNRVDITHVENAADAHLAALDALKTGTCAGKAYFLSQGEPVSLWPWLNDLLTRLGEPTVDRKISYRAARRIGSVAEFLWHTFPLSGEPPMTRFVATELAKSHYFDISAAQRDVGYKPAITTEAGVRALAEHYRVAGTLQ